MVILTPVPSSLEPAYGVGSQHEEPRFHEPMRNFRSEPAFNDFSDLDVPGSGRFQKRPGHNAAPPRAPSAAPPRAPSAAPPRAPSAAPPRAPSAAPPRAPSAAPPMAPSAAPPMAPNDLWKSDGFIEEFHKLLGNLSIISLALIGLHFQGLAVSPLHTHSNIILPFIASTIIYYITYMVIKLQAGGAGPILRFTCIVSGSISIELLYSTFLSLFQLIKVHVYVLSLLSLMLGTYGLFYTAYVLRQRLGTLGRRQTDGNQTEPGTPHLAQPQQ